MTALPSLEADRDLLVDAVREASLLALGLFGKSPKVWMKANDSPVSEADIAVDDFLRARLRAARPGYGWLSEESVDDGTRLTSGRTFVLDPIDGTRSFITGGTDWTIPVAVVEAGRPIVAVLATPRREEFFVAIRGGGATRNGKPIAVSLRRNLNEATLAISRRLIKNVAGFRGKSMFFASLAYRLARVADGRLDGAAIQADAMDWDLAAADLLVHEAGGLLVDLDGNVPRYDRATTSHPPLVAGPEALRGDLLGLARVALAGGAREVPD